MCCVFVYGCDLLASRAMYLPMTGSCENVESGNAKKKAEGEICPFSVDGVRQYKFVHVSVVVCWIAFEASSNAFALQHRNPWRSSCWSHSADTVPVSNW